jgi:hypothetical protein
MKTEIRVEIENHDAIVNMAGTPATLISGAVVVIKAISDKIKLEPNDILSIIKVSIASEILKEVKPTSPMDDLDKVIRDFLNQPTGVMRNENKQDNH